VAKDKWQQDHDAVLAMGGLYVIGTERHESRRIDNQLRGRAGRQGDPGQSQFYVALDDDLMRIFGGEKIQSLMERFNMPDEEALTHPLVSRVLEQIQIKVEGYNFDVRKNVVEYDDVINKQRKIAYNIRDNTLYNAKNSPDTNWADVKKYLTSEIDHIVSPYLDLENSKLDSQKVVLEFSEILPMPESDRQHLTKDLDASSNPQEFLLSLLEKQWQQRVDYFGADLGNSILSYAVIKTLDPLWVDHLTALDDLRDGVRLRGYAQKDPLIEYRKEGFEMFQALMRRFEANLARMLFRLEPVSSPPPTAPSNVTEGRGELEGKPESKPSTQPVVNNSTLGRNDPCWCGSGKKWKKCHYPATS